MNAPSIMLGAVFSDFGCIVFQAPSDNVSAVKWSIDSSFLMKK